MKHPRKYLFTGSQLLLFSCYLLLLTWINMTEYRYPNPPCYKQLCQHLSIGRLLHSAVEKLPPTLSDNCAFLGNTMNNQTTDVLKFRTLWFLKLTRKKKKHRMHIKKSVCLFFILFVDILLIGTPLYIVCIMIFVTFCCFFSLGKTSHSCVMVIVLWLLWTSF